MSSDDIDVASIASVEDLQRVFRSLSTRVDELEGQLAAEQSRREAAEERLNDLENQLDGRYRNLLDDILALEDRVDDAFQGAAQGEIDPERSLPIMQVTRTWKSEPRSLTDTQRRVAMVWSDYFDFCNTTQTRHVLLSSEVKKILGAHDENTHRQTRRDVMELVSELGRQYITLEKVNGQNALVIERASFEEYVADLTGEART